jgi:spermidine synthase
VRGWTSPWSVGPEGRSYWGRDGVVEVQRNRRVWLDGLWHTRLSDGQSHIGDPYSWLMAASAVFAHRDVPLRTALVVGNGVGLTAGTLVKLSGLSVVAYEINHTLARLLADSPKGTLEVASNPRIDIRWQDARSGLALDEHRYDLIVSAPLYLRQAGSSLLLSREYMQLVKSRLHDDGIFALYSREGIAEQALLIHRTVRSVFPHVQLLYDGQITVASRVPIEISEDSIRDRLGRSDPFYREVSRHDAALRGRNTSLYETLHPKVFELEPDVLVITDDHPLVEYPSVVRRLVEPPRVVTTP